MARGRYTKGPQIRILEHGHVTVPKIEAPLPRTDFERTGESHNQGMADSLKYKVGVPRETDHKKGIYDSKISFPTHLPI